MKNTMIDVTERDIENGRSSDPGLWPVALAIGRSLNSDFVNMGFVVTVGEKNYTYPKKVDKFIRDFVSGKKVKPFTFELKEEPNVCVN